MAALLALASAAEAADRRDNDPTGTWELKASSGGTSIESTLTMKDGRFRWSLPSRWKGTREKGQTVSVTLEGDYSVTKDSIVYGIVTKVTLVHSGTDTPTGFPEEEDTFCFRFRVDEDELNVKALKGKGFEELKGATGRYKKKAGTSGAKDKGK
jgi:hypothetical protein